MHLCVLSSPQTIVHCIPVLCFLAIERQKKGHNQRELYVALQGQLGDMDDEFQAGALGAGVVKSDFTSVDQERDQLLHIASTASPSNNHIGLTVSVVGTPANHISWQ